MFKQALVDPSRQNRFVATQIHCPQTQTAIETDFATPMTGSPLLRTNRSVFRCSTTNESDSMAAVDTNGVNRASVAPIHCPATQTAIETDFTEPMTGGPLLRTN